MSKKRGKLKGEKRREREIGENRRKKQKTRKWGTEKTEDENETEQKREKIVSKKLINS